MYCLCAITTCVSSYMYVLFMCNNNSCKLLYVCIVYQVFDKYLLDADWSVCAGNWMWMSSSAFEKVLQCPKCFCPVRYGRKMDPEGAYIRLVLNSFKCSHECLQFVVMISAPGFTIEPEYVLFHTFDWFSVFKRLKYNLDQ